MFTAIPTPIDYYGTFPVSVAVYKVCVKMAVLHKSTFNFSETRQQFEQGKPPQAGAGGLRSKFVHKRNNSDGASLPSSLITPPTTTTTTTTATTTLPPSTHQNHLYDDLPNNSPKKRRPVSMANPQLQVETINNLGWQQGGPAAIDTPSSPTKRNAAAHNTAETPRSPTKTSLATLSAKFSKDKTPKETPPITKPPKKNRSSSNLRGLLSRPRSSRDLTIATDKDTLQSKNKENRKPSDPKSPVTPIYAQYCRGALGGAASVPSSPYETPVDPFTQASLLNLNHSFRPAVSDESSGPKQRPRSFQPQYAPRKSDPPKMDHQKDSRGRLKSNDPADGSRSSTWAKGRSGSRARVMSALSHMGGRKSKSPSPTPEPTEPTEPQFNPQDVDKHLENMLDRRNIPENQRYKMRNLNSTIKMEFIRQDWAENEGKLVRPPTNNSEDSAGLAGKSSVRDTNDKKRARGRSFTFSRNSWKIGTSPSKDKKKDVPTKGHSRNKSTDSVVSERPSSAAGPYTAGSGFIAKVIGQQPSDFVNYLRKVQKPELVEVGKLHKLRLLLRNERVAWTEDFIKQGGMKEIVGLLQRIIGVEWR